MVETRRVKGKKARTVRKRTGEAARRALAGAWHGLGKRSCQQHKGGHGGGEVGSGSEKSHDWKRSKVKVEGIFEEEPVNQYQRLLIRALLSKHQINLKHFSIQHSRGLLDTLSQERWHNAHDGFLQRFFFGLESLILYGDCTFKLPSLTAMIKHGETLKRLKILGTQQEDSGTLDDSIQASST